MLSNVTINNGLYLKSISPNKCGTAGKLIKKCLISIKVMFKILKSKAAVKSLFLETASDRVFKCLLITKNAKNEIINLFRAK